MSDIFISYASSDRDRILALVHALETTGWTIFWDRTIPAGKTWRQHMTEEIQDCRALLVVWTETSVHSEWVLEEAEVGKRKKILVPVLLDDVDPPLGFGLVQAAHLVDWNGRNDTPSFLRLVADIENFLARAPVKGLPAEITREPNQEPVENGFWPTLIAGARALSAWLRRIGGIFIATLLGSVTILVVCEIWLGWDLTQAEVSLIVLLAWLSVVAIATLRHRSKSKNAHATE